ncbi:MAG: DUF4864 domain-containing protein [Gemmataceae bacterium]
MKKKGWLIGCGIFGILGIGACAALGILFVSGIFALTRPVVNASEQFLALLGQEKIAEAYASAASGFRAQQDEASFIVAVKQLGLTDYSSVAWHNRVIENQEGTAEGIVTTKNGSTKPVSIRLVHEEGKWKVVDVRYGGVELITIKAPPTVPPQAEQERMAAEALLSLNQAVRVGDFTAFYGRLSDIWKKETTPLRLKQAFQEFLDKNIDIGAIKDFKPEIAPPAVSDMGVLEMAGHYPTQPSQVGFKLKYANERGGWKLTSIAVSVGKGDAAK